MVEAIGPNLMVEAIGQYGPNWSILTNCFNRKFEIY